MEHMDNGSSCGSTLSCIGSRTQFYQPFNDSLMSIEFDYAGVIREFKESQLIRYKNLSVIIILCLYAIVLITAVIGNVLVVLVILGHPRMRRSPTNYFLLNMAISDLMVALICIPVAMARNAYKAWLLGEIMCRFTPFVQGVAVASGVFTITALSLDRFLAIRYPMLFRRRNPTVFVKASLFIVWISAALLMLPMGMVKRVTSNIIKLPVENFTIKYCTESWTSNTMRHTYAILLLVFIYVIPGLVMTSLYVIMGRRLWTSENDVARHSNSINSNSSATSGRRRVAQMSVVVAVVFAACWLPYYTFSTVLDLRVKSAKSEGAMTVTDGLSIALLLGHANCAINPVLYCFMGRTFRKSMLNFFYACAKCSNIQYQHAQGQSRRMNTTTFRSHYEAASQVNSEVLLATNDRQDHRRDHPLVKLTFSAERQAPKRPSSIRSADSSHGTLRKTVVFASRHGINI